MMGTAQGDSAGVRTHANDRWRHALAFAVVFVLQAFAAGSAFCQPKNEAQARERLNWALDAQRAALEMENASALREVHQYGFLLTGQPNAIEQRDAVYRRGQVVAMTSSREGDLVTSYRLRVDSNVVKPVVFAGVARMLTGVGMHWFLSNQVPE